LFVCPKIFEKMKAPESPKGMERMTEKGRR
jgi:hypothetical protein